MTKKGEVNFATSTRVVLKVHQFHLTMVLWLIAGGSEEKGRFCGVYTCLHSTQVPEEDKNACNFCACNMYDESNDYFSVVLVTTNSVSHISQS